jgi:glycosyltransferase involved in cell wall biosynthesis
MKIGIEAQRLFRPSKYGVEWITLELIHALQKIDRRNDYFIFVKPDEDRSCYTPASNFHIIEIPAYNSMHWEQIQLPRYMRRFRINLLHCTGNTAPVRRDIPLVLTLHDVLFMDEKAKMATRYQQLGSRYKRWIVPRIVEQSDCIITGSAVERNHILQKFPEIDARTVKVIAGGAGEVFRTGRPEPPFTTPYFFFLGSTDPKRNTANVLEAFAQVADEYPEVSLVVADITRGYLEEVLAEIGRKALIRRILISEYIPRDQLPSIYRSASLFLYPSLRDSFGLPVLEAMASGVPVIAANHSVMHEITANAALLVDPSQPSAIAAAIREVYSNRTLADGLIRRGIEGAEAFSWETAARQLLDIYESFK